MRLSYLWQAIHAAQVDSGATFWYLASAVVLTAALVSCVAMTWESYKEWR